MVDPEVEILVVANSNWAAPEVEQAVGGANCCYQDDLHDRHGPLNRQDLPRHDLTSDWYY